ARIPARHEDGVNMAEPLEERPAACQNEAPALRPGGAGGLAGGLSVAMGAGRGAVVKWVPEPDLQPVAVDQIRPVRVEPQVARRTRVRLLGYQLDRVATPDDQVADVLLILLQPPAVIRVRGGAPAQLMAAQRPRGGGAKIEERRFHSARPQS